MATSHNRPHLFHPAWSWCGPFSSALLYPDTSFYNIYHEQGNTFLSATLYYYRQNAPSFHCTNDLVTSFSQHLYPLHTIVRRPSHTRTSNVIQHVRRPSTMLLTVAKRLLLQTYASSYSQRGALETTVNHWAYGCYTFIKTLWHIFCTLILYLPCPHLISPIPSYPSSEKRAHALHSPHKMRRLQPLFSAYSAENNRIFLRKSL